MQYVYTEFNTPPSNECHAVWLPQLPGDSSHSLMTASPLEIPVVDNSSIRRNLKAVNGLKGKVGPPFVGKGDLISALYHFSGFYILDTKSKDRQSTYGSHIWTHRAGNETIDLALVNDFRTVRSGDSRALLASTIDSHDGSERWIHSEKDIESIEGVSQLEEQILKELSVRLLSLYRDFFILALQPTHYRYFTAKMDLNREKLLLKFELMEYVGCISPMIVTGDHILSHESAGTVIAAHPDITTLKIGDRPPIEPNIIYNACEPCLAERYNGCENVQSLSTPPVDGLLCAAGIIREINDSTAAMENKLRPHFILESRLVENGIINLKRLVTNRFMLEEAEKAFETAANPRMGAMYYFTFVSSIGAELFHLSVKIVPASSVGPCDVPLRCSTLMRYVKGLQGGTSWTDGYLAMKTNVKVVPYNDFDVADHLGSTTEGQSLSDWYKHGYIPNFRRAISRTVEYALTDFSLSKVANLLTPDNFEKYLNRTVGFDPLDCGEWISHSYEALPMEYAWLIAFDIQTLITLMEGSKYAEKRLDMKLVPGLKLSSVGSGGTNEIGTTLFDPGQQPFLTQFLNN
ncbi:sorbitol dehydrogenase [Coccidioides immitis H538.4]|uniref:Sorbitol dehydrogenase n=3 Tax=Coccidioides immitis TaxID=5501 RepID=A0A0J8TVW9_COCIT|nr:sorbitol dehydrogenase [Coccidioides immitis RMSCC 2394]KMU78042.1 sorbitol dehydrogenase [Coccidioides immitis RMSCC 3703]KMU82299.1 sorbitol dehydrogenase [Coccidioides immitis H538.4]